MKLCTSIPRQPPKEAPGIFDLFLSYPIILVKYGEYNLSSYFLWKVIIKTLDKNDFDQLRYRLKSFFSELLANWEEKDNFVFYCLAMDSLVQAKRREGITEVNDIENGWSPEIDNTWMDWKK